MEKDLCEVCDYEFNEGDALYKWYDSHYCSEECLHQHHTKAEWMAEYNRLCTGDDGEYDEDNNEDVYYTEWG